MENEIENGETLSGMLLTVVPEMIAGLISIAALFIIFWASLELYKERGFSWRKVLPICLLGTVVVEILVVVADMYLEWEVLVYVEAIGTIVSSAMFFVAALTILRFINYTKST